MNIDGLKDMSWFSVAFHRSISQVFQSYAVGANSPTILAEYIQLQRYSQIAACLEINCGERYNSHCILSDDSALVNKKIQFEHNM